MEFEWDASKEAANIRKHRVTFAEAVETFFDPSGFQMLDRKHSQSEPGFYWVDQRASTDHLVHPPKFCSPNHRIRRVETVQETLL